MSSKRFENFEKVHILLVWKIFFNIPVRSILDWSKEEYVAHYAVCKFGLHGPFWAAHGKFGEGIHSEEGFAFFPALPHPGFRREISRRLGCKLAKNIAISGPEWSESEWVHPEWVQNTAFFVFIILSYQQKSFHQNYISHTFKLTCFILLCTVFIGMHYSRPYANWSYQSILGLLKPYLETAATCCWWAEERREKGEFFFSFCVQSRILVSRFGLFIVLSVCLSPSMPNTLKDMYENAAKLYVYLMSVG